MENKQKIAKLKHLIDSATYVFIANGYRRTQISDIAQVMGVAPGTIYLYVQSKEALFHLLAGYHSRLISLGDEIELPVSLPSPDVTLAMFREKIVPMANFTSLAAALVREKPTDPRAELLEIAADLYDLLHANRLGIKLLERSAMDWPELAAVFFIEMRQKLLDQLAAYVAARMKSGCFRPRQDERVATRFLLETLSIFAIHLHFDFLAGPPYEEATTRSTVLQLLADAFCPETADKFPPHQD